MKNEWEYTQWLLTLSSQERRELRIRSVSWIRDGLRHGSIRKEEAQRTIPLSDLQTLLDELVIEERYEDCGDVFNLMKELWNYQSENGELEMENTSSHSL
jgi:hypothetical protein